MNKNSVTKFSYLKYKQMHKDFCDGKISESEWVAFCLEFLEHWMRIHQSVSSHLKEWESKQCTEELQF